MSWRDLSRNRAEVDGDLVSRVWFEWFRLQFGFAEAASQNADGEVVGRTVGMHVDQFHDPVCIGGVGRDEQFGARIAGEDERLLEWLCCVAQYVLAIFDAALIDGRVDCLRCRFVDGVSTAVKVDGGELRLVDSLVSDNRGADGGGLHITGGRVWLQRSEVSRNRSEANGGGIHQSGGELWLINSLLRGNLAARGGGGLAISGGVAELQNSSVIGNVANADAGGEQIGGGLLSEGKAKVRLRNSIVSANRVLAMTFGNECAGSEIFADAANFIGPDPGCQPRSADNDLVLRSAAAMTTTMRPLPWGGLRVMAMPSPGHPAIDAGVSGCLADIDLDADTPDQPLLIDLRQLPRPAVNGARRCDLGAIQTRCDANCTDTVVQAAPSDAAVTPSNPLFQAQTATPRHASASRTRDTSRP